MSYFTRPFSLLCLLAVLSTTANAQTADGQSANGVEETCDAFATAWLARDAKAVAEFLTNDAVVFSENGSDLSGINGAMRYINRNFKNVTSTETIVHRSVKTIGTTAIVTVVVRVDHVGKGRPKSMPQRQTQIWVRTNEAWKLAHLHISRYSDFETSIAAFERADKANAPKPGGVVFVGSSSIRMWKSLQEDFPGTNTVHRGFGGSQLVDSIMYAHRIITPYKPSKVAVYAGDNDVNAGKNAERVLQDFKVLVESIHSRAPDAEIGFIAIKPSRSRWKLWPEMDKANNLVADFAKTHPKVTYLNIATPMLNSDGSPPAKDWFIADGLHMTPKGYELWTKVMKPWVDSK